MSVIFRKRNHNNKGHRVREAANEGDDEDETRIVRPEKSGNKGFTEQPTQITVGTVFESSKEVIPQKYAGDATHTSEIDTATDRDTRAILERTLKLEADGILDAEPKVYHGQAGYKSFVKRDVSQIGANKLTGTQGPIRAPSFVRSSCRFDYQPDICKDYKETGFCGYGDQCKFLHDRGDYKSGWQLEKEWDEQQARKKKRLEETLAKFSTEEDASYVPEENRAEQVEYENEFVVADDEEEFPFACYLCRSDFRNPIVTLCEHYFCGPCILAKQKETTRCPVCDKQTYGVFNKAHKLVKKLQSTGKLVAEDHTSTSATVVATGQTVKKSTGSWADVS